LVDGDDNNEPIADAARSILDGHIVLDRKLTSRGHYPPINVLQSLSRVMPMVVGNEHVRASQRIRQLMAAYADVEDLISVGAYKSGTQPESDEAVEKWARINAFLRQGKEDPTDFAETIAAMENIAHA
jgi:flagellum-specific ATP synthase